MTDFSDNHTSDEGEGDAARGDSDDEEWAAFLADHADEIRSIESSSQARRFDEQARRRERKAAKESKRDAAPGGGRPRGPRDAETSIFDEAPDDHFDPPDPKVELDQYTKVYGAMLIVGVVLLVLALFVPAAGWLGGIGGLMTLIGLVALIARHMQR